MKKLRKPILMATIDVGAHAARMLIAQVDKDNSFEVIEGLEQPVPLGADVFSRGRISNEAVWLLCSIFRNFREKMEEYRIEHYKAIATSAVREAANSDIFIERIFHESGIRLQIFEGIDGARLDYLTVVNDIHGRFNFKTKKMFIADIGTGACQISCYEKGNICFTETIKTGTLRILEEMSANISSTALKEVLSPFVSKSFSQLRHISYSLKAEAVIAMGSSVRALALLTGGAGAGHDGKVISVSREKFTECLEIAAGREPEKLSEDYGIDKEIAEAVVPCGMILDHLFELAGATRLIVPMTSTKDALLLDYINELTRKRDYFSAQILGVVKNIARKYNSLDKLTESVVEYSKFLFQKTADVHGLSEKDEMLLVMAAYLHKIGLFVNNRGYHKLSSYLILCTEIPGIKAEQRKTVALVARYHRKAFPKPAHVDYMAMAPGSKRKINKLAAILRLACGIAGVLGPFKTFVVKNTDEILYLNFKNRQGRVLNKTDILKSADLFSYVFSKNIEVD